MYTYNYPRPSVTADIVLFSKNNVDYSVLLIERAHEPFKGCWALPGGFVDENEDLPDTAMRELIEETGISGVDLEPIGVFGKPGRDPRGHTITIAFMAVVPNQINATAGDDAANVKWFSMSDLPNLAFDHDEIIKLALNKAELLPNNATFKNY